MNRWLRSLGPGLLITAAFIGPGTVMTASGAGANYQLQLVWAVLFSVAAAMILQEMAARLGVVGRMGLGEAIRESIPHSGLRIAAAVLVVAAIAAGNAAFQYGNITGAVFGVSGALGKSGEWALRPLIAIVIALVALGLLATGSSKAIQAALSGLVAVMSVVFLVTAFLTPVDWSAAAAGLVPRVPDGAMVSVLALIGTTVVPYNLFLHASASRERWSPDDERDDKNDKTAGGQQVAESLREARFGTFTAIAIGGVITLSILIVAAGALDKGATLSAENLCGMLTERLGTAGQWLVAIGLFSAGLTSAVTAPLAAAYAASGVVGFSKESNPGAFRGVWLAVLAIGGVFAATMTKNPAAGIIFAQATNGVLLPLVAIFLFSVVNRKAIMGEYANGTLSNVLGFVVIATATTLGARNIYKAFESLFGS